MKVQSTKDIKPTKINCLIYGASGAGKTTLASGLQQKTLILSLESGLLSLKNFAVDYVEIDAPTPKGKYEQLRQTLIEVGKTDYVNVYIDSLTDVAQIFVDVCKEDFPDPKQALPMWGKYSEMMKSFLKYTRDFNKNVFYTALEKVDKDEIGRRFYVPDIQGSIATKCPAMFDFVFYLKIFEKEDGEHVRALLTRSQDGFICKDRSGELEVYEKPHLQEIINKVFNTKK